jgi:hypothetical protein
MQATAVRFTVLISLLLGTWLIQTAAAHHDWRWAEEANSEITGTIKTVQPGNSHELVMLDVNGEEWTAEVGQPSRIHQAGLADDKLAPGLTLTIQGHRAADKALKVIKAERMVIDGKTYSLYPDRD